ncbi:hypothetical protein RhiirC2_857106 [Rhizophagus irregularis]|uniref:Uncharacterized protein n=1 Tax=Rhizophagus irregularis TaxID=588596 RepID=A0A2N1MEE0_9GLOM|nr:hypothetical protein RhiirC2_857106 [Rhizophagus irregularis]
MCSYRKLMNIPCIKECKRLQFAKMKVIVIIKLMDMTTLFPIFLLRNLKQSISISLRNNFLYYVIAMYSQIYFILFICKPSSGNNLFHK